MAMSILLKFMTLGWDISITISRMMAHFFFIFHALSFEVNFFFNWSFPLTAQRAFMNNFENVFNTTVDIQEDIKCYQDTRATVIGLLKNWPVNLCK